MNYIKPIKRAILNALLGFFIFAVLSFAAQYVYEKFSPDHWWVEYDSIVTKSFYTVGEVPQFKSIAIYPKGGSTEWTDVLKCDIGNDGHFVFFSVYNSSANISSTNEFPVVYEDNQLAGGWLYQSPTPEIETLCYIDSTTEIRTPLGLTKTDKIKTNVFRIVK